MAKITSNKPFDGAISKYFEKGAPKEIRKAIEKAGKNDLIDPAYPFRKELDSDDYASELEKLQIELVKMQAWVRETGQRIVIVFEGRDAAGKGGAIARFSENLNPRYARNVALAKPSDTERSQWYFQRYIAHLPSAGEIVFFDRSWYNRAIVEHVFGFCDKDQRARFFAQVCEFEAMLVKDGIRLWKMWLTVSRAEQLRRFLERESDPLKGWKLSQIDIDGLTKWDDYTKAIAQTMQRTHNAVTPWTIVQSEDQKRARLTAIRAVLSTLDYTGKNKTVAAPPDPLLCSGPELLGISKA